MKAFEQIEEHIRNCVSYDDWLNLNCPTTWNISQNKYRVWVLQSSLLFQKLDFEKFMGFKKIDAKRAMFGKNYNSFIIKGILGERSMFMSFPQYYWDNYTCIKLPETKKEANKWKILLKFIGTITGIIPFIGQREGAITNISPMIDCGEFLYFTGAAFSHVGSKRNWMAQKRYDNLTTFYYSYDFFIYKDIHLMNKRIAKKMNPINKMNIYHSDKKLNEVVKKHYLLHNHLNSQGSGRIFASANKDKQFTMIHRGYSVIRNGKQLYVSGLKEFYNFYPGHFGSFVLFNSYEEWVRHFTSIIHDKFYSIIN